MNVITKNGWTATYIYKKKLNAPLVCVTDSDCVFAILSDCIVWGETVEYLKDLNLGSFLACTRTLNTWRLMSPQTQAWQLLYLCLDILASYRPNIYHCSWTAGDLRLSDLDRHAGLLM